MSVLKKWLKRIPFLKKIFEKLNNQKARDGFVIGELKKIPAGKLLLDAGCGSQRYREYCSHLTYKAQDFGRFEVDKTPSFTSTKDRYQYGKIDYVGDIWDIDEGNGAFDCILCTEVFEHIPFPIETVKEFSRLLKTGGQLILTAPSNCLRHMDPYYFYTGFTDRWYEKILSENGFKIDKMIAQGDYYSWMKVEMGRTMLSGNLFRAIILSPAFMYFSLKNKTPESAAALCEGYHVLATKAG